MPFRRATRQETLDWLGSGRVMFRRIPPASSTGKPAGSSETPKPGAPQEILDAMDRVIEAGFQAQYAYEMELERQAAAEPSQASPPLSETEQDPICS